MKITFITSNRIKIAQFLQTFQDGNIEVDFVGNEKPEIQADTGVEIAASLLCFVSWVELVGDCGFVFCIFLWVRTLPENQSPSGLPFCCRALGGSDRARRWSPLRSCVSFLGWSVWENTALCFFGLGASQVFEALIDGQSSLFFRLDCFCFLRSFCHASCFYRTQSLARTCLGGGFAACR